MTSTDIIVMIIILAVLSLVIGYIVKAKKKGQACIGCPHGSSCSKKNCCSNK